jgi:hypothetical protein
LRNRKDFFDIPKKIHINEEQSDWADSRCEEKKLAFAAYVRWLIDEDKNRVEEELSQQKQCSNRPNLDPNMGNPNGLSQHEIQAVAVAVAAALGQLNKKS